jgi:hypothetical protein
MISFYFLVFFDDFFEDFRPVDVSAGPCREGCEHHHGDDAEEDLLLD